MYKSETFPLWITPWVSGIYTLYEPDRCLDEDAKGYVPAILTAYLDEFGDANLMMHILDFTELTGGEVEWCHWVGVKWRGGDRVALYGRQDSEGWKIEFKMEVPLSVDETDDLMTELREYEAGRTEKGSLTVAEALIKHLPLVNRLGIWDGESKLGWLDEEYEDDEEGRDEWWNKMIAPFLDRPVIPLVDKTWIRSPWYERETYTHDISDFPPHPDHNFTTDLLSRNEIK